MGVFERAKRLCELMFILQERGYSVAQLAERYDVCPRTIRYDLQALQGDPFWCPLYHYGGVVRLIPPDKPSKYWIPLKCREVVAEMVEL